MFFIDKKNRNCTKRALKGDFQPMQVPQDAQLLGQAVLGSSSGPGEGLLVNTWVGNSPETGRRRRATSRSFVCYFSYSLMLQLWSVTPTCKVPWVLNERHCKTWLYNIRLFYNCIITIAATLRLLLSVIPTFACGIIDLALSGHVSIHLLVAGTGYPNVFHLKLFMLMGLIWNSFT